MQINQYQIQEFMEYFSGSQHNYGEHVYDDEIDEGEKRQGKSKTVKNKLLTIEQYKKHLEGEKGLGVIPINEGNKSKFATIDIDIYNMDYNLYIKAIENSGFPLIPFYSKSGGLHLYIFFKEWTNSAQAIEVLRKFCFYLSIDTLVKNKNGTSVEIFPKQKKLKKGDVGSWINLPYFNAVDSKSVAIRDGVSLKFNEALSYIKAKSTSITEVEEFLEEIPYNDAPPCLQLLSILSPFKKGGGRNNYLFSFGVYLKKKDEDFFEANLQDINNGLEFPLTEEELEKTVIQSLKKKEYIYRCKESPCYDFCNKKECKKREYGIGKNEGYFSSVEVGTLYQYKTLQPYYEWEVKLQDQEHFKRLRFKTEDEIIRQDAFLRLCMRELHELPSKLKQSEWFAKVNTALKEIEVVKVDMEEDTSPFMILRGMVMEFLTGKAMAETKDQIFAEKVYYCPQTQSYQFRVKDLTKFLYVQKQFRYFTPNELHGMLREMNCTYKKITTETRKQIRVAVFYHKEFIMQENIYDTVTPNFEAMAEEGF